MNSFYISSNQLDFFNLLPHDWKSEISAAWPSYSKNASIYLLEQAGEIVAGGIVFDICPPDMLYNEPEAKSWLEAGYLYIGFLWVVEEFRSQKLGSKWLEFLLNKYPSQKFWLTIDDESLKHFYFKNGFRLVKSLQNGQDLEWLLVYEPTE